MHLENIVVDALDPRALGRFWAAALATETLTDEPDLFETRLSVPDGPVLDLCFQRVLQRPVEPQRLHLDLLGAPSPQRVVDRLLAQGASRADIGQGDVEWVVLADPEGNAFCVMEDRPTYVGTGPIAALPLDVADPVRERDFWAWLTGWAPVESADALSLRHPSGRGPLLELCVEPAAKRTPYAAGKNRMHLDVRLGPEDEVGQVAGAIIDRGGREHHPDWGDLPWRCFTDPSGNEFCVLPTAGS